MCRSCWYFLICDLDSVGPAANAGVAGVGVQLPSGDAVQSVFGQRVRPRAAQGPRAGSGLRAHATVGVFAIVNSGETRSLPGVKSLSRVGEDPTGGPRWWA